MGIGKAESAFFRMINDEGGINGRKIKLITLDDGYSPPKTVEQTRKLVEEDQVLLISTRSARRPTRRSKIPQREEGAAAVRRHRRDQWGDPKDFPWTMGWQPTYQTEGRIYANTS